MQSTAKSQMDRPGEFQMSQIPNVSTNLCRPRLFGTGFILPGLHSCGVPGVHSRFVSVSAREVGF